jgi:ABC-type sugar transport system substrate-binding protein
MKSVKPDYFLTGYYIDATDSLMDYSSKNPTRIFLITAAPPISEAEKVGLPREKYKNFIGQLTPNDKEFGYTEADYLIKMAKRSGLANSQKQVNIIAFAGFNEDDVSDSRLQGLKKRIAEGNDAVLLKTTLAGWSRELAHKYTLELLKENPSINAIWSANDDIAIGCIEAAQAAGRHPGKDILIGGIDLSEKTIDYIENGQQAVSVGGQFMEAAWSLIMLYDYHHGFDFDDRSNYVFHSEAHAVTKENAAEFRKYFLPEDWNEIDFKLLTKTHNPALKKYDFSLEAVQKILAQQDK